MRRRLVLSLVGLLALAGSLAACQTDQKMFGACAPAPSGNPFGTDGTYVLQCKENVWQPVMTVQEFIKLSRGEHVTIGPLPTSTTTTSTTSTTSSTTTTTI